MNRDYADLFGENVRFCRDLKDMTQEELAEGLPVGRTAVTNIETGAARPTLNTAAAIADALDVSLDLLCGLDPDDHPAEPTLDSQMDALAEGHRETHARLSRVETLLTSGEDGLLEQVRVTCANGHTMTLLDARDTYDCTAPCCPRCDECSFTFEPSDVFAFGAQ